MKKLKKIVAVAILTSAMLALGACGDGYKEFDLDKCEEELFTGFCMEENHKNHLDFFCKNHNQLCYIACITKIKTEKIGNHKDCDICLIESIKEEKRSNLDKNIQILGFNLDIPKIILSSFLEIF